MPYAKADILVNTETKKVYDFTLRIKPRHDVLGAKTMFKRSKIKNVLILGDKGYDAEELYQIASDKGNVFYAPIRKSSRKRPKGRFRKKAFDNPPHNKGMRSIAESVIRSLKNRINSLRSRLHFMKKREFAWHLITYNLELLLQLLSKWLMILPIQCYSG